MAYFVPRSAGFDTATKDRTSLRYIKLYIDVLDNDNFVDMTSYINWRGGLSGGGSGQGELGVSTKRYSVRLKNSDEYFSEGDYAGHKCYLQAKIGTSEYITFFTGFIDEKGCARSKQTKSGDIVTLVMQDASRSRGMRKKVSATTFVNYKISDTVSPGASLFHKLAAELGYSSSDVETTTINQTKDYLPLDPKKTVWHELQALSAQYIGHMAFRYDGKLRFISRHQQGWSEPSSEWTFKGDNATGEQVDYNIHNWRGQLSPIACNKIKTELVEYESLGSQTIYKNTDDWDRVNARNAISIAAGVYWPGSNAGDKAQLYYQDPKSGEKFPLGITIQTPTIGGVGSGSDIECENGLLTLISFNGSTAATMQRPNASEIILRNNTGSTIIIRKFELRGTPLREQKIKIVELIDASVVDDWNYREKTIPGKYGVSDTQAKLSCERWLEFGKVERKIFTFTTDWIPQIQEGAVVTFNPDSSINMSVVVESYSHRCVGKYRQWRTNISVREKETFTPSETPDITVESPGDAHTTELDNMVTTTDIIDGFTTGGGTKTPTQVTVAVCKPVGKKAILLIWDKQLNLTNFDHYDIQVSEDQSDWYSLAFDGEGAFKGWGDQIAGLTENPGEMVVHSNIPNTGDADDPQGQLLYYRVRRVTKAAVDGTWSTIVSATSRTVESGDVAADTIYLNNLVAGILNAMIGEFSNYIQVSSDGYLGTSYLVGGDPTPGLSTRARLDENELIIEFYDNTSTWITITKMGGDEAGGFFPWFQARGLIKTGAVSEVAALDIGHKVPSDGKIFDFENDYKDYDDIDPWDTKYGQLEFTLDEKYGLYALASSPNTSGYQECGLSGKSESSLTGLTAGSVYYLKITIDGGTEIEYNFTAAVNNEFVYIPSGGVTVSGQAVTSRDPFVCIGSGLVNISGAASFQHVGEDYTYAGKGEVLLTGSASTEIASPAYEYSGSGEVVVSGTGVEGVLFAELIASLNVVVASATFSMNGGDLRCTSNTSGNDSSIVLAVGTTGTDLFDSLNGYTAFDNAVQGIAGGYIEDEDAQGIVWSSGFGIDAWLYLKDLPPSAMDILKLHQVDYTFEVWGNGESFDAGEANAGASCMAQLDSTHFILAYGQNARPLYACIGTVNVVNKSMSWGARYNYTNGDSGYNASVCRIDATHAVILYAGGSTGPIYWLRIIVATINGTVITYGTPATITTAASWRPRNIQALDSTHVAITYGNTTTTQDCRTIIGTISGGDSISVGSSVLVSSIYHGSVASIVILDSTHYVITYYDYSSPNAYGRCKVATVSGGNTISLGSAQTYVTTSTTGSYVVIHTCNVLDESTYKFVIVYRIGYTSNYAIVATRDENTITFGSTNLFTTDVDYWAVLTKMNLTHLAFVWTDDSDGYLKSLVMIVEDPLITFGSIYTIESNVYAYLCACPIGDDIEEDTRGFACSAFRGSTTDREGFVGYAPRQDMSVRVHTDTLAFKLESEFTSESIKSFTIGEGWFHISINFSSSGEVLYFSLNASRDSISLSSTDLNTVDGSKLALLVLEPNYSIRWDDLLVLPSTYLDVDSYSIDHFGNNQPWVEGIDYAKDLVLVPKTGGSVVIDGELSFTDDEVPGSGWHKFANPSTGWKASKTTWATADSFSAGLEVTFSEVPAGAKAVKVIIYLGTLARNSYWRKSGDTNISNTPDATGEYSHRFGDAIGSYETVVWLSADYKTQFTVSDVSVDLYISYPVGYLI